MKLKAEMQVVVNRTRELTALYHRHRGVRRVLIPDGVGAWRYYTLSREQAKFWRSLSGTERSFLTRLSRGTCFVCALKDVMARQERFEAGLHRAMMSFLLVRVG